MTIDQIKTAADTNIRAKTADNSVTRDEVADLFDNLADEQRDRGLFGVDTTAGLAAVSGANYRKVAVGDTGIFEWASTGTANGTTIFAASGGGVWILKMAIPKGALAALNSIDYTSGYITNKPTLGGLAAVNSIDYTSGALTNKPDLTLKADLVGGKVPSAQLPSYVDDVEEYANLAALPGTGEAGKIYITLDNNSTYRWSGSQYVLLVSGGGGGSQSLDSVLGVGNVTDSEYIFSSSSNNIFYFKGQPSNYLTDYGVKGTAGRFTAGWSLHDVNGSGRPNVVSFYGYNAGIGGGREISTEPSVQYRIETHYESGGDLIELHHPAIIYNDGVERRLWSVYTQKTGLAPATIRARNNGIEFTNWIDENITWGVLQPGVLQIMQDTIGGGMPLFKLGSVVNSLANGTTWDIDWSFQIGYVENNSHIVKIGRSSAAAISDNITTTVLLDNIEIGTPSKSRDLKHYGDINLFKENGKMLPFGGGYDLGAIGNKFTNIWGVNGLFDTINVTNISVTNPIVTQGININGDLKKLDFNGLYYINVDFGSGEIKHFASGGGYIPTFYSNGGEAMRLTYYRNMLIGTTTDDNSAILNVSSTSKGLLPPRMTKTQRNAIPSPGPGLIVIVVGETGGEYQSIYNANQTRWEKVSTTAD